MSTPSSSPTRSGTAPIAARTTAASDDRVQTAIKDFDKRQDPSVFEQVSCECEATWELVMDEETSYNMPLAR